MYISSMRQAGTRIVLVYLTALLLVIGIGILAFVHLYQISRTVDDLTNNLAVQRALSKDIVSQVLLTRFYANNFVWRQRQVDLDRFDEEFAKLEVLLALADRQIIDPERTEMLSRIDQAVRDYRATFEQVTEIVKDRQTIYATAIDLKELDIEYRLAALRINVDFLAYPDHFFALGNAQNAFRLMSLNTTKYLATGDERYAVQFGESYRNLQEALSSLVVANLGPTLYQNAADAKAAADIYYRGFQTIHTDYVKSKQLLDTMLNVLEPEISDTASDIATSIDAEFKTQNEYAQALIYRTRVVLLATTTIAILAGLGLGIVFSHYVSERFRAEEMLRQSEQRYRTLFEGMPVGLYRSSSTGQIVDANPALVQMLNYPDRNALLSINAADLYVDVGDRRRWQSLIAADGLVHDYEVRLRRYDGEVILVRNKAQIARSNDQISTYYEGSLEDITDQVRTEQELAQYRHHLEALVEARTAELAAANQRLTKEITQREQVQQSLRRAKEQAEAANRAKSAFLANMSHELRTPLNAILGFADLLARSPNLPTEQRTNASIITTSGEHLLSLINQVLDLSKIEAGRMSLDEKEIDLFQVLDNLEEMFQLRAAEKGLRLVFDRCPDTPRYVRIDEVKLRQVLINLLSNGLKFTHQGSVWLRVSTAQKHSSLKIGQMPPDPQRSDTVTLHFEIEDTGPGLAPSEMENLFKAFTQTKAGQQAQEGTGLGLTISQKFVQLMGGQISVYSEPGEGARFTFDLPVKILKEADLDRSFGLTRRATGLEPGQPVYRLLIVDDNRDNRQLLMSILEPLGFALRAAKNGREAVEIWAEWQPHLIWMDIRMPVMDGREATRRIKATDRGQDTIVIALSASAFEKDRAEVVAVGCDDFIRKPFTEPEIIEVLRRHLGVRFVSEEVEPSGLAAGAQGLERQELPDAIRALPAELLAGLEHATIRLDVEMIQRYLEHAQTYDADLAGVLAELAAEFKYDQIAAAIQKAQEKKNG